MNNNIEENTKNFSFFRVPRMLFESTEYSSLSAEAKLLFALILDRLDLSAVNADKYSDDNGRIYSLYPYDEIRDKLKISNTKINRIISELVTCGLIEKNKLRNGEPNRFFITAKARADILKSFNPDCKNPHTKNETVIAQNQRQPMPQIRDGQCSKSESSYTDNNYINSSYTYQSITYEEAVEEIKEQIEYDCINGDPEIVQEIIMIMYDVIYGTASTVRIGANVFPRSAVVARYKKLEAEHIENVIIALETTTRKITNVKSFLITALYNAPATAASGTAADFSFYQKSKELE